MTPAELFDLLHERFGIGVYDDIVRADTPWWQERGRQIAKLKAMMRKRHVSEFQVVIAADYASATHKSIKYYPQVFELIPEAMRAFRKAERLADKRTVQDALADAIDEALRNGLDDWSGRLMRVADVDAGRLLTEWRSRG